MADGAQRAQRRSWHAQHSPAAGGAIRSPAERDRQRIWRRMELAPGWKAEPPTTAQRHDGKGIPPFAIAEKTH